MDFRIPEKRTPVACTNCRVRKIKCRPGSQGKCDSCDKRDLECEYRPPEPVQPASTPPSASNTAPNSTSYHPTQQNVHPRSPAGFSGHDHSGSPAVYTNAAAIYPPSNIAPANQHGGAIPHVYGYQDGSGHLLGQSLPSTLRGEFRTGNESDFASPNDQCIVPGSMSHPVAYPQYPTNIGQPPGHNQAQYPYSLMRATCEHGNSCRCRSTSA